jgi:hypothetical protein
MENEAAYFHYILECLLWLEQGGWSGLDARVPRGCGLLALDSTMLSSWHFADGNRLITESNLLTHIR